MTTTNLTSAQKTLTQSWKERIDSWSESGLSKSAYCKNHNINYHQMIYWSNKLSPTNVSSSGFVVKCLFWERTGFVLYYKALSEERFHWPSSEETLVTLTGVQFNWLLDGYNLALMQPHRVLQYESVG